jgi:hypothetical protein
MVWSVRGVGAQSYNPTSRPAQVKKGKPDGAHRDHVHLEHLILVVLHAHSLVAHRAYVRAIRSQTLCSTELRAHRLFWLHAHFEHLIRRCAWCSTDRACRASDPTPKPIGAGTRNRDMVTRPEPLWELEAG